jgi:hypothetical protein
MGVHEFVHLAPENLLMALQHFNVWNMDVNAVAHFAFTCFGNYKVGTTGRGDSKAQIIIGPIFDEGPFGQLNEVESVLIQILKVTVVMFRVDVGVKSYRNIIGNYFIAVFQGFTDFFIGVGVGA